MQQEKPKESSGPSHSEALTIIRELMRGAENARTEGIRYHRDGDIEISKASYMEFANTNMYLGNLYKEASPEVRTTVGLLYGEFFADATLGFVKAGELEMALGSISIAKREFANEKSDDTHTKWELGELSSRATVLEETLSQLVRDNKNGSLNDSRAIAMARSAVEEYAIY